MWKMRRGEFHQITFSENVTKLLCLSTLLTHFGFESISSYLFIFCYPISAVMSFVLHGKHLQTDQKKIMHLLIFF